MRKLLLLSVVLAGCVDQEPRFDNESLAITGGVEIDTPASKAIVLVTLNGNPKCSGTFVHPYYILTAAHCLPACPPGGSGCWWTQDGTTDDLIDGDGWTGFDGPVAGYAANDGLTGTGGNPYPIDQVYFPRSSDYDNGVPPEYALLRTTKPFRG